MFAKMQKLGKRRLVACFTRIAVMAIAVLGASPLFAADEVAATPGQTSPDAKVDSQFAGWQGMRVIGVEGAPARLLAADLDSDGRQELILVNTRQSRIDFFHWLPADRRKPPATPDADRPNELPLAPDWSFSELDLDELPVDLVTHDLDGDGKLELIIVVSPSNRALVYKKDASDQWKKTISWDLLAGGSLQGRSPLLIRQLPNGPAELLIGFEQGIETLTLVEGQRPAWLTPRETRGRLDWRLCDLDGDGDQDLVEWSANPRQTIRFYPCHEGRLLPAQSLHDQTVQGMESLSPPGKPSELLLLGGMQEGMLHRRVLARGAESELGRHDALPIANAATTAWCGFSLEGKPALAAVDASQPKLRLIELGADGWLPERSYPILAGTKTMASPAGKPGTLLFWAKDAAELQESHWESGRLSYPKPFAASAEKDRKILALETVGSTTWWAQKVGPDLDLYVWPADRPEATKSRFAGIGAKVDSLIWVGGERLLFKEQFATSAKIAKLEEGKVAISEPANFAKVDLAEFRLVSREGNLTPTRLTDGVLQWLGEDLQPVDQVMLTDGQRLAGYVAGNQGEAWALEAGGAFIHRLKPDAGGVPRVVESIRAPGGSSLVRDQVLGLILIDQDRVIRLSQGAPWELKLLESIDSRVGRPSGVKEATIHRFMTVDATPSPTREVLLCDDVRHQLTVLEWREEGFKSMISWPVFEDQTYPYGGVQGGQVSEPRAVIGFEGDGDGHQDLALLCHDRLLIYLARDSKDKTP